LLFSGYDADLNLYTYVGNDPTDRTDPTGMDTNCTYDASRIGAASDSICGGTKDPNNPDASAGSSNNKVTHPVRVAQEAEGEPVELPRFGEEEETRSSESQPQNAQPRNPNMDYPGEGPPVEWPPNFGFRGTPTTITLEPGERIDRFGGPSGTFAAPEGLPFAQRSIPEEARSRDYYRYEVVKPIPGVKAGTTVPWFGQPGGGMQYQMPQNFQQLEQQGYIKVVK
jgi:hypothetical protein